ncbi:P-loop containing nucleoside triphosphate hydrolase protein [Basidiobolus meristosporus CBS 931.73]|uniref:Cell division control protein n=1 Tax=Basidiobolus meristosporus CBS 931.73 TaxID=1314790 RepID=A0A1Y1XC11_9FUNG|nr:P-loop containing nucleoside triphosphate hydrolase protein [Basidiobolus meristosporus CBS 931.73]|eukprot:ORX83257.1 P-loop containing nucleoside triphosphate hydrolase protein [Basidiobolus meristosporus CBS 931.73]
MVKEQTSQLQSLLRPYQNLPKKQRHPESQGTHKPKKPTLPIPIIAQRKLASTNPSSDFEKARQMLHVSTVPETLPCREDEFCEILAYLESALEDGTGGCIYISGVPGTGKTATVREVIRSLQARVADGDLEPFQFIEMNGMKLTEPSHAYSALWEAFTEEKVTPKHAADLLEHMFSSPSTRQQPCLLLMDELDLLVTRKQTVMYNFFEWPNRPEAKLTVIAIANTMDLPERLLSNKVSSRLGLTRINFQPYTHSQLYTIIQSRLQDSGTFESDAIEFCARKVSAVSGDARRALDICRRAVELVEYMHLRERGDDSTHTSQVTISMVDRAVKEMFVTSNVQLIHSATLHQKLFLAALVARLKKNGLPEVEFTEVIQTYFQLCRMNSIEPVTTSELTVVCNYLNSSRFILLEQTNLDLYQRIRLNLSEGDIMLALRNDPFFKKII